jgi:transketolase
MISNAIAIAKKRAGDKPTVIEISTIIGFGSRFQNSNKIHGSPLNEEQIKELRETLNYKVAPFTIHPSVFDDMEVAYRRGIDKQKLFNQALQRLESKNLNLYQEYIKLSSNKFNFNLD